MKTCLTCSSETATPRSSFCTDCIVARGLYRTTQNNLASGFNRKYKGSPMLTMSIDDFTRWRRQVEQKCHYCGITEQEIPKVGMKSQIQRT